MEIPVIACMNVLWTRAVPISYAYNFYLLFFLEILLKLT